MGGDGTILIYDADKIDAAGLRDSFFDTFANTNEEVLFERRIYTAYYDTQFNDYKIAKWCIWT